MLYIECILCAFHPQACRTGPTKTRTVKSTVYQNNKPAEYDEIDLLELAAVLFAHIKLLIAALILGTGIALAITRFLIIPQYTATSTLYIFSKTTSITSLADLQIGSQLTNDFRVPAADISNAMAQSQRCPRLCGRRGCQAEEYRHQYSGRRAE